MDDHQVIELLQDLVRIPSVNPAGTPGTPHTGEAQLAGYVADFLKKLALDVEVHEVEPGRPNVIGKFTSRGSQRSVALAPHTDTVSVAGMTIDPFGGNLRDGRVYGRGACDTKGSLAAFLAALANLVRRQEFRAGNLDVVLCALMSEEDGNTGAKALAARGFQPDFLIAGEPTECRIVYTHKGTLWFKLITRGCSAHGATPDRGDSAIQKMAGVIHYLLGDYAATLHSRVAAPLGAPTINIGVIRGGSQSNMVPDYCEIEIDRRTLPGEGHAQIVTAVCQALQHLGVEAGPELGCVPLATDPGNPWVQQLATATGFGDGALVGAPWFCDAAIFAERGIPAVAFGPGNIAQAHTPDEFIETAEVVRAMEIVERFLLTRTAM